MKHAFLIISHNEFEVLQMLIDRLDSERTDIFVHIDKKVKALPALHTKHSELHVLENRIDVRWGHVSQIECELLLFETAFKHGPYQHYHMLSGTHLPLKPLDELLCFYDQHQGEEIMDIWETCTGRGNIKLGKWNFGIRNFQSKNPRIKRLTQFLWRLHMAVQKRLPIYRLPDAQYVKSSNWVSLTQKAVEYLISLKEYIIGKYKYSLCGDEYFVATELSHADFRLYDEKKLLFQIWNIDGARLLNEKDLKAMISSNCLYARKFASANLFITKQLNR